MNNWKPCCSTCFYAQNYWVETESGKTHDRPRIEGYWVRVKTECQWVKLEAPKAPHFVPRSYEIMAPDSFCCAAWKCSPNVEDMAEHHEWKKGE